ncbi:uncharacterized protein [Physcomitrium patens]|uniref:Peptidase C14 caspase domain-containing protein n=1 Tax=Physcomitrium patens TaxID=3218 RepID=A0A2K1ISA3_PHYPA|nr:uncharacterized protein LOC112274548 isoform X2 [Physcomitrium patens]PNR32155.1 hypothetical protein PHYPA_026280 [Physcomitrium patens]|eukprot:XP_024359973.1 uncharacterized protein LOC112274548 isoform X2 [Physcomitrella patens]
MPTKKALLVGINYEGQPHHALRGCWKDVERMGECLVSRYGFPKESICTLVDRPGTSPDLMPTGEIIRRKLEELTRDLKWGDCIVFHFSGHGLQMPPEGEPDETGMKEAVVPVDANMITDDDFRILVDKIPDGVFFTFIADCCHSGGLIAHCEQQVGSVHTKPVSILSTLGPQQKEEEEAPNSIEIVIDEEMMMQILATMLGSTPSADQSVSLLEILAVMQTNQSVPQEVSLLDLVALYISSQQGQNMDMSDVLESMVGAEEMNATDNQRGLFVATRSLHQDKQLKKDRIQSILAKTKAYNIERLLRVNGGHRSMSMEFRGPSAGFAGQYEHQNYNRSPYDNSQPAAPSHNYGYPPPPGAHHYPNSDAPWQRPSLHHTVSAPAAYNYLHTDTSYTSSDNPFGPHPSMQRWGSDLGGTYGAGHDRHIGQNIHGDMAIYPPPWAKHAPEDRYAAPNFGNSHEGFRGSYNGNLETVQPGAWPYGGANLGQSSGRYDANLATSKYTSKRSMPVHAVTQMLSARAGHTVEPGNICANLYDLFGDKSSVTCKEIVHTVFNGLRSKGGSKREILKRISSKSIDFLSAKLHSSSLRDSNYQQQTATRDLTDATPENLSHIPKRPDRCILITACQSDETASEHRNEIHGAFTKTLLDIVDEHKGPLDNHRLVYECRQRLARKPYGQHPCLYSTPAQAHHVFICY